MLVHPGSLSPKVLDKQKKLWKPNTEQEVCPIKVLCWKYADKLENAMHVYSQGHFCEYTSEQCLLITYLVNEICGHYFMTKR